MNGALGPRCSTRSTPTNRESDSERSIRARARTGPGRARSVHRTDLAQAATQSEAPREARRQLRARTTRSRLDRGVPLGLGPLRQNDDRSARDCVDPREGSNAQNPVRVLRVRIRSQANWQSDGDREACGSAARLDAPQRRMDDARGRAREGVRDRRTAHGRRLHGHHHRRPAQESRGGREPRNPRGRDRGVLQRHRDAARSTRHEHLGHSRAMERQRLDRRADACGAPAVCDVQYAGARRAGPVERAGALHGRTAQAPSRPRGSVHMGIALPGRAAAERRSALRCDHAREALPAEEIPRGNRDRSRTDDGAASGSQRGSHDAQGSRHGADRHPRRCACSRNDHESSRRSRGRRRGFRKAASAAHSCASGRGARDVCGGERALARRPLVAAAFRCGRPNDHGQRRPGRGRQVDARAEIRGELERLEGSDRWPYSGRRRAREDNDGRRAQPRRLATRVCCGARCVHGDQGSGRRSSRCRRGRARLAERRSKEDDARRGNGEREGTNGDDGWRAKDERR